MDEKIKLNPEEARKDLTLRECTKILGGPIGGLCGMTDKETLAKAILWWAQNFEASELYQVARKAEENMRKAASAR
jgi:hypothetical protein